MNAEAEARSALRAYLADHELDPWLADGPVGARYRAMREDGDAKTPSEAFGRWFSTILRSAPASEAESLGWIAWLIAGRPAEELLGEIDETTAAAIASHAPLPRFEAPLAMPVQELRRFRGRAGAGDRFRSPGAGAAAGRSA
jgi:hypothetical protein